MLTTPRDVVATVLVAALVLVYLAYLAFDGIPLIRDATGMAGLGLLLGFASRRVGGRSDYEHDQAAFTAGLGTMAVGAAALATGSEAILAMFMACTLTLWVTAAYARMRAGGTGTGRHHPAFR